MSRRLTLLTITTLVGASLVLIPLGSVSTAAAGSTAAGTPRCAGHNATIVGNARDRGVLSGTSGRDVIVTHGQMRTNSRGGRDLICVTGGGRQKIKAGDGDDRILVPKDRRVGVGVTPGSGDDVVRGGAGRDHITQRGAHGRDILRLGAGDDAVFYSRDSRDDRTRYRDADLVRLGAGNDRLTRLVGTPFPSDGAKYSGGAGRDLVLLAEPREPRRPLADIDVNMTAGTLLADGRTVRVSGVEELRLYATRAASIDYRGTEGDDLFISFPSSDTAQLLGGDDEIRALGTDGAPTLDGGPGLDLIDFGAGAVSVTADLAAGTASVRADELTENYQFTGFENARAQVFDTVRLTGTDGPNLVEVAGCDVEVVTLDGDDVVRYRRNEAVGGDCGVPAGWRLDGGGGDDHLTSHDLDDILIGGPGTDIADGAAGVDHCEAETRIDCES